MRRVDFRVDSRWHDGRASIVTFDLEELLATKLRALYQRRKGRDLYDLWLALTTRDVEGDVLLDCFARYMEHGSASVSRRQFEENLAAKLESRDFRDDVIPLLRDGAGYDAAEAAAIVSERLVSRLDA